MTATAPRLAESPTDAFVRLHQRGLWRWLRALGCEAAHAEEHCQDALLAALAAGAPDWPRAAASRWLQRAAKNLFLMRLRQQRRRPDQASLEAIATEWAAVGADEDGGQAALAALRHCVQLLPARGREVLERRYGAGESRAAMAQTLGLREAGVKQALRRLRDRLRDCVHRRLAKSDLNDPDLIGPDPTDSARHGELR